MFAAHLEIRRVVFEMLLHTHTQLVDPLPLGLQGGTVGLRTCREHSEVQANGASASSAAFTSESRDSKLSQSHLHSLFGWMVLLAQTMGRFLERPHHLLLCIQLQPHFLSTQEDGRHMV